jgi:hypothetical protein
LIETEPKSVGKNAPAFLLFTIKLIAARQTSIPKPRVDDVGFDMLKYGWRLDIAVDEFFCFLLNAGWQMWQLACAANDDTLRGDHVSVCRQGSRNIFSFQIPCGVFGWGFYT